MSTPLVVSTAKLTNVCAVSRRWTSRDGSGVAGLAYSWVLGRRHERELLNFRPHNVSMVGLGTFILWFGWLGFNGGSAFGANLRAVMAVWNSMLAASFGGIVWCLLDYGTSRSGAWSLLLGDDCRIGSCHACVRLYPPWAAIIMVCDWYAV